jgi:hypothetical protein
MTTTHSDIARACALNGSDPISVLYALFEGLESRHRTYRQTWGPDMGPGAGLFTEVVDLMDMEATEETPPSILAAVELHLRIRVKREPANAALAVAWEVTRGFLQKANYQEKRLGTDDASRQLPPA